MSTEKLEYTLCTFTTSVDLAEEVIQDWKQFLSPPPDKVIILVGTEKEVPDAWREMEVKGVIDKAVPFLLNGGTPKEVCVSAIMHLLTLIDTPWIVYTQLDVLPFRRGHDHWLGQMHQEISDDPTLIGATGSFRTHDVKPRSGQFFHTGSFSANFAFIKPHLWLDVIDKALQLAEIESHIPRDKLLSENRFVLEFALETYLYLSSKRLLLKPDCEDWSIFHLNKWGKELAPLREKYRNRDGVAKYFNTGKKLNRPEYLLPDYRRYYGHCRPPFGTRLMWTAKTILRSLRDLFR